MLIVLKRMEGSSAQLSDFKKGKKYDNMQHAEEALAAMASTVPAEGHRVAWEIRNGNPEWVGYGSLDLLPGDLEKRDALKRSVQELYGGVSLS